MFLQFLWFIWTSMAVNGFRKPSRKSCSLAGSGIPVFPWEIKPIGTIDPLHICGNAANLEYRTIRFFYRSENFFCFVLQIGCIPTDMQGVCAKQIAWYMSGGWHCSFKLKVILYSLEFQGHSSNKEEWEENAYRAVCKADDHWDGK